MFLLCDKMETMGKKTKSLYLKQVTAKWTTGLVTRFKPLIQANRMKQFLAGATLLLGQLIVGSMNNGIANAALFNAIEFLIHILFPDLQALYDGSVLMGQICCQLNEPVSPLLFTDTKTSNRRNLNNSQRIVNWQLDNQLHVQFLHLIS